MATHANSTTTPALKLLPASKPTLLRDALRMKRERGDTDADLFKAIVIDDFGAGLNATIGGAIWAYPQWIAKADKLGWPARKVESRKRVLAELQLIVASIAGVREAIRLAFEEGAFLCTLSENCLRSALAYLDREALV